MSTATHGTGASTSANRRLRRNAADRMRREWFLLRFDWAMQDYPSRASRQIRRDLRADLEVAAAEVGMTRALHDLGHPSALADSYKEELGRPLPRYVSGAVAAGLAVGFLAYLAIAYAIGTLDTLEALGGGSVTTRPLGAATTFTSTADEISVQTHMTWQWATLYVSIAVVTFLVGSRIWRAVR